VFDPASRARLTKRDLDRFPSDRLFDRLGRALCAAECLPRRELFESWEVARRVRRHFRGGRVVDLAAGHGLLAQVMLLLDEASPEAVAIDTTWPASCGPVHAALLAVWPRLTDRVRFETRDLAQAALAPGDLVVSSHACGALTDRILDQAMAAGARVAVLPCCHPVQSSDLCGWVDGALAVDIARVARLRAAGYRVRTQTIPSTITIKNRLLMAEPHHAEAPRP
jgi:hypothetical protein